MGDRADVVLKTLRRFAAAGRSPDRARDEIEGHFTMVETQLADEAPASPPAPRGQRAGGPHAPEDITTIGQSVVIEGEVKGGEDIVIDGKVDGTLELPQHVLTVGPTGRVEAQLSVKFCLGVRAGSAARPGGGRHRHQDEHESPDEDDAEQRWRLPSRLSAPRARARSEGGTASRNQPPPTE